jgi:excisionase family DNA binding protein
MSSKTTDRSQPGSIKPLEAADRELALAAQRYIVAALDHCRAASITVTTAEGSQPKVEVPPAALRLIGQLLGLLGEGRPVVLLPDDKEFTTVEAANFLNVSRPFVIKEIEANRLPCRKVGTHRRIAFGDLLQYAQQMRARQAGALEKMAENARELGLEY